MPKYVPRPVTWVGWLVQVVIGVAIVALIWSAPKVLYFLSIIAVGFFIESRRQARRLQRMAEARAGESICDFARSFSCSETDTWVIRAVYEQLQAYLRSDAANFPLRRDDNLVKQLGIDPEDLAYDLADEIAARSGRSLEDTERNPFWKKVETVGDLVRFFEHQPRKAV